MITAKTAYNNTVDEINKVYPEDIEKIERFILSNIKMHNFHCEYCFSEFDTLKKVHFIKNYLETFGFEVYFRDNVYYYSIDIYWDK